MGYLDDRAVIKLSMFLQKSNYKSAVFDGPEGVTLEVNLKAMGEAGPAEAVYMRRSGGRWKAVFVGPAMPWNEYDLGDKAIGQLELMLTMEQVNPNKQVPSAPPVDPQSPLGRFVRYMRRVHPSVAIEEMDSRLTDEGAISLDFGRSSHAIVVPLDGNWMIMYVNPGTNDVVGELALPESVQHDEAYEAIDASWRY